MAYNSKKPITLGNMPVRYYERFDRYYTDKNGKRVFVKGTPATPEPKAPKKK